jgi:signal transduction histidine kinase
MRSEERRRRWRSQPILLGEPGSAEQLAEVARLWVLVWFTASAMGLELTALVVVAPAQSGPPGYLPLLTVVMLPFGLAMAVLTHWRPKLFSPTTFTYVLSVCILGLGVASWVAGPALAPLLAVYVSWIAFPVTYLPRRVIVALMAWMGVVQAAVLVLQDGNFLPLARWAVVVGGTVTTAVVLNRLVERARALARGEQGARAEAERTRAELEVVSAHKTRFLARMSHELRTPLNAIIGFSEVLARRSFGPLEPKQAEYVGDVVDSGRHLLALVDDLLDLAKVETGTVELDAGPADLAELLGGSLTLFGEQAGRHRIALAFHVDPDLPTIEADARKLKQVVFNLLANAVRFTPAGGRVTLGARRNGDRVRIWVSDTGPGIAAGDLDAIFEEFRQGTPSDRGQGGTGLGLPLARRLIEAHGGSLWVESEPGAGSTFTAELPLRPRPPAAVEHGAASQERPVPLLLGEPDSPDRRMETARLIITFGVAAVVMGAIFMVAMGVHPVPELARYRQLSFASVTGLAVVALVAAALRPQWLGAPAVLPYVGATLVIATSVTAYALGPVMGPYAAVFYGWASAGAFLVLPFRQRVIQLVLIGGGYGAVLLFQGGNSLPLLRWLVVMQGVMVSGLMWGRLVARIQALAVAARAARAEAEQVGAELELASRHKTEFLANMSHELRTPLNVIIGFSEVLASQAFGPLNEKQAEYVDDVLASGRHLLGLINDILDLAKADAGRMELQLADLDVDATLAAVVRPFQEDATRRRVTLHLEAGPGRMHADEAKLTQALGHLVSNALKFTPDGGTVTVRAARDAEAVEISVTDTGRGVASGDFERIFDAFAHGDGSAATEQGSGLGLALARRYAELHGGSLTVRSDPGSGATFSLHLPVSLGTDDRAAPAEVA